MKVEMTKALLGWAPYDKFPSRVGTVRPERPKTNKQTAQNSSLFNQLSNEHHMYLPDDRDQAQHTHAQLRISGSTFTFQSTKRELQILPRRAFCFFKVRILKRKRKNSSKLDFSDLIANTIKSSILAVFRETSFNSQLCEYLFVYSQV